MLVWMWIWISWVVPYQPWMEGELWELYARNPQAFPLMLQIPLDIRLISRNTQDPTLQAMLDHLFWDDDTSLSLRLWGRTTQDSSSWQLLEGGWVVPAGPFHFTWNARVVRASGSLVYPDRTWRGDLSGDLMTGMASWVRPPFWIALGRSPMIFGSDLASALLLGSQSPPLDVLFAHYTWRNLRGFFAWSILDRTRIRAEDVALDPTLVEGAFIHRFLSLHGFEILWKNLRVRLSEIVLYTGVYRSVEGYYLNPFQLYLAGHYNRGGQDNISWDLTLHYFLNRSLVFAELYIDDAQYQTPPTREPDQLAWTMGIFHPIGPWSILLRYTRVNAWTYLHEGRFQNWEYLGFPMGYAFGPDVEDIRASLARTHFRWRLQVDAWIRNKGENTIHTPWPIPPDLQGVFPSGSNFMWGVVKHRLGAAFSFRFYRSYGFVGGRIGVEHVSNAQHIPGRRQWEHHIQLEGQIRIP